MPPPVTFSNFRPFSPYHDDNPLVDFFEDSAQRVTSVLACVLAVHIGLYFALTQNFIVPDLKPEDPDPVEVQIIVLDRAAQNITDQENPQPVSEVQDSSLNLSPAIPIQAPPPQLKPAPEPDPIPKPEPIPTPVPEPELIFEPTPELITEPIPEALTEPDPIAEALPDSLPEAQIAPPPIIRQEAIETLESLPPESILPETPVPLAEPSEVKPELVFEPYIAPEIVPEIIEETIPETVPEIVPEIVPDNPLPDLDLDPVDNPEPIDNNDPVQTQIEPEILPEIIPETIPEIIPETPLITPDPVELPPSSGAILENPTPSDVISQTPDLEIIEPEIAEPEIAEPKIIVPENVEPEIDPETDIALPKIETVPSEPDIITTAPTILASPDAPISIEEAEKAVPQSQSDPFLDLLQRDNQSRPSVSQDNPRNPAIAGPRRGGGNLGIPPPSGGTKRGGPAAGNWQIAPGDFGEGSGKGYDGIALDIRCRELTRTHEDCPEYVRQLEGRDAEGFESFRGRAGRGSNAGSNLRPSGRVLPNRRDLGIASPVGSSISGFGSPDTIARQGSEFSLAPERAPSSRPIQTQEPGRVRDLIFSGANDKAGSNSPVSDFDKDLVNLPPDGPNQDSPNQNNLNNDSDTSWILKDP